jgi:hypothetical protein
MLIYVLRWRPSWISDRHAGLSLTLDPMGKMFQNASSLKPLGQLKPNCPGMIIVMSSTNCLFVMPIGNPRSCYQCYIWYWLALDFHLLTKIPSTSLVFPLQLQSTCSQGRFVDIMRKMLFTDSSSKQKLVILNNNGTLDKEITCSPHFSRDVTLIDDSIVAVSTSGLHSLFEIFCLQML